MRIIVVILFSILNFMAPATQSIYSIQSGNANLNVKAHSINHKEAIILLHGGPGVPDDMTEVVNLLKEKYNVITFEQRGVGGSTCKNCVYSMDEYIADIDAISTFFKLGSFHLFGHSWGGLYAQIYAASQPDKIKSLFLCSPSSGTNESWKKTEKEVMHFNKNNTSSGEWLKMGWNSLLGMLGSNKAYRQLFKQVLINYHKNHTEVLFDDAFFRKINAEPINKTRKEVIKYKALKTINNPNFLITITYGDNDIYGESKNEVIARFPSAENILINNCGHIPWKHNLVEFQDIITKHYSL